MNYNSTEQKRSSPPHFISHRDSLCLALIFMLASLSLTPLMAQDPLWTIGAQRVIFEDTCEEEATYPLPVPEPISGYPLEYFYDGTPALLAQQVQYDQHGQLMFFIIDGNVYDKRGYLIADVEDELQNCPYCYITLGNRMNPEFNIIPVPGSNNCSLFYVVYSYGDNINSITQLEYLILDISAENPLFPGEGIFGAPLDNTTINQYPQFNGLSTTGNGNTPIGYQISFYTPTTTSGNPQGYVRKEVVDFGDNTDKLLFVNYESGYDIFDVTASGIVENSFGVGYNEAGGKIPIPGEMEVQQHFADPSLMTVAVLKPLSALHPYIRLHTITADGQLSPAGNQNEIYSNSLPLPGLNLTSNNLPTRVNGMEFDPTGRYLYITASQGVNYDTGVFICYDLQNGTNIPIHGLLPQEFFTTQHFNSQLELNYEFDYEILSPEETLRVAVPCIYLKTETGIARLRQVDSPLSPNMTYGAINGTYSGAQYESNGSAVRQLNKQNLNGTQIIPYLQDLCCYDPNFVHAIGDVHIKLTDENYMNLWTQEENPLWPLLGYETNCIPIRVNGTITFHAGVDVRLNDMLLEFGPQGRVVIQDGASVHLANNTTLTKIDCDEVLWKGVTIEGNTSVDQNPFVNGDQGYLLMTDSATIEFAEFGARVKGGGILRSYDSFFKNNRFSVLMNPYEFMSFSNKSLFYNTDFVTDDALVPLGETPAYHLMMNGVQGVSILYSSFLNLAEFSNYTIYERGGGIYSLNSSFRLFGNDAPYDEVDEEEHDSFYQLRVGCLAWNWDNKSFSCERMEFQDNLFGILVDGTLAPQITFNDFHVRQAEIIPGVSNFRPRGIHLIESTGYIVQENFFDADEADIQYGIIAEDSGEENNLIMRNAFDALGTGVYSAGLNANLNSVYQAGLQVRCNTMENDNLDIYAGPNSLWNTFQGDPGLGLLEFLANNKFSYNSCLASERDIVAHPTYGQVAGFLGDPAFDYWTFDIAVPSNDIVIPELDCLNPDIIQVGSPSFASGIEFDYLDHCPTQFSEGDPDVPSRYMEGDTRNLGSIESDILTERVALDDAVELYELTVDNGERLDMLAAIQQTMTVSSEQLRALLFARSPLSEEVLKESIRRTPSMDPWHLCQVLIGNAPLRPGVMRVLEEEGSLSPFFMSFVYSAQDNVSLGIKQLLEQEMSYRSGKIDADERLLLQRLLHDEWWVDESISADKALVAQFLLNHGGSKAQSHRLINSWSMGDLSQANALLAEYEAGSESHMWYSELIGIDPVNGPTDTQKDALWSRYDNRDPHCYEALMILTGHDDIGIEWPEPPLPEKSLIPLRSRSGAALEAVELITASPNPTSGALYLGYPAEADGRAIIEIFDSKGSLVMRTDLSGLGVLEIDTQEWKSGLYIAALSAEGILIDNVKIHVD